MRSINMQLMKFMSGQDWRLIEADFGKGQHHSTRVPADLIGVKLEPQN